MEVEINDEKRMTIVWLRKDEDKQLSQPIIDRYRGTNYKVVVFRSGSADLTANTSALLRHNKECLARHEAAL